jgi:predicted DNA-binding transcriptional regulator AlpA
MHETICFVFISMQIKESFVGVKSNKVDVQPQRNANAQADSSADIEQLPAPFQLIVRKCRVCKDFGVMPAKRTADKAGVGVSTLWRDVKMGVFVPPIRLSERRVAWLEAEVDAMLEAKKLISRTGLLIDLQVFVNVLIGVSQKQRLQQDGN